MNYRIDVTRIDDTGTEESCALMSLSKEPVAMETVGLTLAESKALLHDLQVYLVDQQASAYLIQHRTCSECGHRYTSKGHGHTSVNTMFGPVAIPNPRWHRCPCQDKGPRTFRPTTQWLHGHTSPELLYVETKWASLIPYAKVVDLLKEVLPVASTLNVETVRQHVQSTGTRLEDALGEERECLFSGTEEDWASQPLPDGPMTVGIDGGMVRGRHKRGCFEVIAGKSVVTFKRKDAADRPSSKRFGFVQAYDHKSRRRLWELMKSQGMQENQQVVFMSDGGETVRQLQAYLHPTSEHSLTGSISPCASRS